ncbi:MAG: helix-turn-helix domain-containing protein [Prevotella sp.]|nr:helix-turn-helix domain-containing protein [Prevotella sp.]
MEKRYSVVILFALVLASGLTSFGSYRSTERIVTNEMNRALALTMAEQKSDIICQDTIRVFNSHLETEQLRGKAVLAVDTRHREFRCVPKCSAATIFAMSDQKPATVLWTLTLLWATFCFYRRRQLVTLLADMQQYGGLNYAVTSGTFYDAQGERVKLTPMQQQLMEMFFRSESHQLTKTEICNALWPKKDDPSDTLYTLIRRLKPVVEQHSNLKIESDRGRAYELKIK